MHSIASSQAAVTVPSCLHTCCAAVWSMRRTHGTEPHKNCPAMCRIPWDDLLLRAPPEERLAQIEVALGELEFRQHAQRFTRLWAAMRSAEQAAAAAGVA